MSQPDSSFPASARIFKGNFYGVVKRVEIWLPFDFRSAATFVSFRFLCSEFLCRTRPLSHTRTHIHVLARRNPALVESAGNRSEIDHAAVQVLVPDFRLSVLCRIEFNSDDRSRWPGLHQHQTKRAECLFKSELRR